MVLQRDGWLCQLKLEGCTTKANQVHHTVGRAVTGDDPAHLVASCQSCNSKVGDPTKAADPRPIARTRW
jgi:5-methylcytosine-specific restriction endonuclease McrA